MGCDIHMYVEFNRNNHWSGKKSWMNGDYFHSIDPTDSKYEMLHIGLCENRCYSLFGVLADVRNDGYPYISEPRGLPDDATEYVKNEYETWGWDAHSCSYLTMREIIEFDKEFAPRNTFEGRILEPLITRLKQRADELGVVYDFEFREPFTEDLLKKMDNIRIVFWFDN